MDKTLYYNINTDIKAPTSGGFRLLKNPDFFVALPKPVRSRISAYAPVTGFWQRLELENFSKVCEFEISYSISSPHKWGLHVWHIPVMDATAFLQCSLQDRPPLLNSPTHCHTMKRLSPFYLRLLK